jgi:hypothetical protein
MNLEYFLKSRDKEIEDLKKDGSILLTFKSMHPNEKGGEILEYRSDKDIAEYKRKFKDLYAKMIPPDKHSDTFLKFHLDDVVVETAEGLHYGNMTYYDGQDYYLSSRVFSKKPLDVFAYTKMVSDKGEEDGGIPAWSVKSIKRMNATEGSVDNDRRRFGN